MVLTGLAPSSRAEEKRIKPPSKEKPRHLRWALIILANALAVLFLLAAVEAAAVLLNRRAGEGRKPFLIDTAELFRASDSLRQVGTTTKMSFLDPHLGYAHEHSIDRDLSRGASVPGFVVYGELGSRPLLTIVALGGSTTDPLDKSNWPRALQALLEERGVRSVVYNGGVSGYSSNQELLKLIRDVLPLEPDLIISMNGMNDMGFMHSVVEHPMVHPYQERMLAALRGKRPGVFMPNTLRAYQRWRSERTPDYYRVKGVNFGPRVSVSPADQWARNLRMMHAVVQSAKIEYVCFLQPALGVGQYTPTPKEREMLKAAARMFGGQYLEMLDDFYSNAVPIADATPYVENLTETFAGKSGLYRDARHPNAEGYRVIAEVIAAHVAERLGV